MRKLILAFFVAVGLGACSEQEPDLYTGQQLEFDLFKSSDFDYNGTVDIADLGILATNWQLQLASSAAPAATAVRTRSVPNRMATEVL